MQAFPRVSFFGGLSPEKMRSFSVLILCRTLSGVLRGSPLRAAFTETLGKLLTLHEKEQVVGWWWTSDRLDFAHAAGAQRIKPDTVLFGYQVLCEPRG